MRRGYFHGIICSLNREWIWLWKYYRITCYAHTTEINIYSTGTCCNYRERFGL